jgi:DNA topoisomerase IB
VGRGFAYLDEHGERLDREHVTRIKALVIPPAWERVWICPDERGHIQAVGVDAAGRRQYLYHPAWREQRDRMKFDRVAEVAGQLPAARAAIAEHISLDGMPRQRAAATAVRLLDKGYFRIGSDAYADANGSFGLTTLEKRHVSRARDRLVFCFVGKSGKEHCIEIDDPLAVAAVETMRRRRSGGDRLLAYQQARQWRPLDAALVNDYLTESGVVDMTAKDFRTWHATVLAAESLATSEEKGATKTSRARAVRATMKQVAAYLGNTPAVARSSYVDPRVVDLYEDGVTIADAVRTGYADLEQRQAAIERAVLRLLAEAPDWSTRLPRSA